MKHIEDYSVHDDLPESLNRPNAKELAELWDKTQLKFIDSQISKILIYPVIDELDSDLVDALAVQLHCDFYDKSLSLKARRQIVKTSIAWHRIKGTPAAVEMLTQTIFHESYTKEWFNYGGRAYFFRMVQDITDGTEDVTPETLARLKKAIWMGKNVRSWLEMLEFIVHLHDRVDCNEELSRLTIRRNFEDWMPYGNRLWVPERDGSLYRGGAAYRDGEFCRNGFLIHDGMTPGEWPFHHGWDELSMDELFLAAHLAFFEKNLHPIALGADLCCDSLPSFQKLHILLTAMDGNSDIFLGCTNLRQWCFSLLTFILDEHKALSPSVHGSGKK